MSLTGPVASKYVLYNFRNPGGNYSVPERPRRNLEKRTCTSTTDVAFFPYFAISRAPVVYLIRNIRFSIVSRISFYPGGKRSWGYGIFYGQPQLIRLCLKRP